VTHPRPAVVPRSSRNGASFANARWNDGLIDVEPLSVGSEIVVRRAKLTKTDVVYPMAVEFDDGEHVILAGPFSGSVAVDLGYVTFEPDDHFVEHFWRSRWYTVADVSDPVRGRKGWYCDVTRPAEVAAGAVTFVDLDLDVWVPRVRARCWFSTRTSSTPAACPTATLTPQRRPGWHFKCCAQQPTMGSRGC
jgi:hypothetical protein